MQLLGAKEISSRGIRALARLERKITRIIGGSGGFCDTRGRDCSGIFRRRQITARCFGRVEQLRLLRFECGSSHDNLRPLALATLSVEIRAVELLAQLAQRPLTLLDVGARHAECGANFLLVPGVRAQRFVRGGERGFELRQLARRAVELSADATRDGIPLAALLFGALPARSRIAQPLLGNRNLPPQLLGTLALIGDESAKLRASGLGGRPGGEGNIAL
jgi:hypothetical protein